MGEYCQDVSSGYVLAVNQTCNGTMCKCTNLNGTTLHDEREKAVVLARVLTAADYGITDKSLGSEDAKRLAQAELDGMIGMVEGKVFFAEMRKKVEYVERTGDTKLLHTSLNMRITGNPGTGKTTLARLLFRYLHAYGVLPKDTFVEKNGLELKGQYVGQSCPRVVDAVADAMGGCLFIDEAHVCVCVFT